VAESKPPLNKIIADFFIYLKLVILILNIYFKMLTAFFDLSKVLSGG